MAIAITTTWHNANPNTVWGKLAARLGREPTYDEAKAEVRRILEAGLIDAAEAGKLPHQRGRVR